MNDFPRVVESVHNDPHARQITSGLGQSLLELRHPDIDVLGYVVAAEDHQEDRRGNV